MASKKTSPPRPVAGIVFGRSMTKTLGLIALWAVLGFIGFCALMGPLTSGTWSTVPTKQLAVGFGLVVLGPVMIFQLVRSCWVRRRLVIGPHCLQVVEQLAAGYGKDTVVLHIPYANIADVKYEENALRVGIDLHRLDDPKTYAPEEDFEGNKESKEWHYCILVGYERGPRAIAKALKRELAEWAEK